MSRPRDILAARRRTAGLAKLTLAVAVASAACLPTVVAPAARAADPKLDAVVEAMRQRRAQQAADGDAKRKRRADELEAHRTEAAGMPRLRASRVEDVLQVSVGPDGRLGVATPAADADPAKADEYQVVVDGLAGGPAVLDVDTVASARPTGPRPGPKAAADGKPGRRVVFGVYNGDDPDALANLTLDAMPASFTLARQVQRNEGTDIVQLSDLRDPSTPGGGVVTLRVIRSGETVAQPVGLSIQEPDFPTLLREHSAEAQAYVRPLFRELGQDHLFAPDAKTAWQVLADAWPPDPASAGAVAAVLPRLADPDYRRRDAALNDLIALGRRGATALRKLDRSTLSAEQGRLVGLALAPYNQLPRGDAIRLAADPAFLLDCIHIDDRDIRRAAVNRLGRVLRRDDLPNLLDGTDADRRAAVRRLKWVVANREAFTAEGPSTRPAGEGTPGSRPADTRPAETRPSTRP